MRDGSCTNGNLRSGLARPLTIPPRDAERDQTRTGVARVLTWAANTGSLEDSDLLISASVDEVMSRRALHQLRWCRLASDVVFSGLWMPMGNLKKVESDGDCETSDISSEGTPC